MQKKGFCFLQFIWPRSQEKLYMIGAMLGWGCEQPFRVSGWNITLFVSWSQTATDEYIEREDARFQQAADLLLRGLAPAPGEAASSVASSLRLGE